MTTTAAVVEIEAEHIQSQNTKANALLDSVINTIESPRIDPSLLTPGSSTQSQSRDSPESPAVSESVDSQRTVWPIEGRSSPRPVSTQNPLPPRLKVNPRSSRSSYNDAESLPPRFHAPQPIPVLRVPPPPHYPPWYPQTPDRMWGVDRYLRLYLSHVSVRSTSTPQPWYHPGTPVSPMNANAAQEPLPSPNDLNSTPDHGLWACLRETRAGIRSEDDFVIARLIS